MAKDEFKSRVYTDRPAYADFDPARKFSAIESIVAGKLKQHPKAICSYSGGADSDILLDMIERVRHVFNYPPVKYVFFNTGLEMEATKRHVRETAEKYGVEIETCRPKVGIVQAVRKYGIPFVSKIMSSSLEGIQRKNVPLDIHDEYWAAEDKIAKRQELKERYPNCQSEINFLCCCNSAGEPRPNIQLVINSSPYMLDFIKENPIPFKVSAKCCTYCKKNLAHDVQKGYEMIITGERRAEGGMRSVPRKDNTALCFTETSSGQYRLRPLYYVSDKDKEWYKEYYNIRYSDAYEVYGFTRTGCCGCSISSKAIEDLERLRPYEPNLYKAAWNVFGESYRYREKYNEYKRMRRTLLPAQTQEYKRKELMGMPWRLAFALQADGWYLRQDIIWHKPNCMPESVKDRCTKSHEYIFLLTKSDKYYFNSEAIKEPVVSVNNIPPAGSRGTLTPNSRRRVGYGNRRNAAKFRNKRDVWSVSTHGYKEAHFATFPEKLIEPCVMAGCPAGGMILDPFIGSGTVAAVAQRYGCGCIGIEINPMYAEIAVRRIGKSN